MKRLKLLIVLTITSYICFSQSIKLTPTVLNNGDTLFCFSIRQSRFIASELVNAKYCAMANKVSTDIIQWQDSIIKAQSVQVNLLGAVNENDIKMINNLEGLVKSCKYNLAISEKKIERYKKSRWIMLSAGFVAGLVLPFIIN